MPRRRAPAAPAGLTHFDGGGAAHMVDVGQKPETARVAVASARVACAPATLRAIAAGTIGKGDVLGIARTAGLAGLKRTAELIPLCHPVRVVGADLELRVDRRAGCVHIRATVRAFDRTGVEMEALTCASIAALTVYDMCKAIDRGMRVDALQLEEKHGGKSGSWQR